MSDADPAAPRGAGSVPVDHTADVGLRVWAPELEVFFREAAAGLTRLLAGGGKVRSRERQELALQGMDREELLVAWLNEILYRFESGGWLVGAVDTLAIEESNAGCRLQAVIRGESRDPTRHPPGPGVKAATYHNLKLESDPRGGYDAVIIFDT